MEVEHPLLRTGKRDTLFRVRCTTRECQISTLQWYPKTAAVESWNRRVGAPGRKTKRREKQHFATASAMALDRRQEPERRAGDA